MNKHSYLCAYRFWQTACKRAFIFKVASAAEKKKKKVVVIIVSSAQKQLHNEKHSEQVFTSNSVITLAHSRLSSPDSFKSEK